MTTAYLASAGVLLATLAALGWLLVRGFRRRRLYLRRMRGN